jgi:hypothetical protein
VQREITNQGWMFPFNWKRSKKLRVSIQLISPTSGESRWAFKHHSDCSAAVSIPLVSPMSRELSRTQEHRTPLHDDVSIQLVSPTSRESR